LSSICSQTPFYYALPLYDDVRQVSHFPYFSFPLTFFIHLFLLRASPFSILLWLLSWKQIDFKFHPFLEKKKKKKKKKKTKQANKTKQNKTPLIVLCENQKKMHSFPWYSRFCLAHHVFLLIQSFLSVLLSIGNVLRAFAAGPFPCGLLSSFGPPLVSVPRSHSLPSVFSSRP
jgi:hypothetical protein